MLAMHLGLNGLYLWPLVWTSEKKEERIWVKFHENVARFLGIHHVKVNVVKQRIIP